MLACWAELLLASASALAFIPPAVRAVVYCLTDTPASIWVEVRIRGAFNLGLWLADAFTLVLAPLIVGGLTFHVLLTITFTVFFVPDIREWAVLGLNFADTVALFLIPDLAFWTCLRDAFTATGSLIVVIAVNAAYWIPATTFALRISKPDLGFDTLAWFVHTIAFACFEVECPIFAMDA